MTDRVCLVEGCGNRAGVPGTARGLCSTHYKRLRKHGDPLIGGRTRSTCSVDGCDKPCVGRGWCSKHWTRWDRYGDAEHRFPWEIRDGKKVCPRCESDLPLTEFGRHARSTDDRSVYCKTCTRTISVEWRAANPAYVQPPTDPAQAREWARRWREANPEQVRAQTALYRARKQGAATERFTPQEIFDRDAWLCGICRQAVDKALTYPHPLSVSLDHVVPLSRGGDHSRANTQASHLVCNLRKYANLTREAVGA